MKTKSRNTPWIHRMGLRPDLALRPFRIAKMAVAGSGDTDEHELSCDEVLDLLDQYAEMTQAGQDAAHLLPLVRRHLDRCPECREEYEALMRILAADA